MATGQAELAFERLAERSRTSTKEWARGVEATARALLSEGSEAEKPVPSRPSSSGVLACSSSMLARS